MRLVLANVNGIRAAHRRGGLAWLGERNADVLALQEVRATRAQVEELATAVVPGWTVTHDEGPAGRAGVAVLTPHEVLGSRTGLGGIDAAGRWIETAVSIPGIGPVTIVSAYVHTGEAGTPRQDEKYAFLAAMSARMGELRGGLTVVTGDLNIAHTQQDLRNWKGNRGKAGYLPGEQAVLTSWADEGWVDAGRAFAGDVDGPYTWWSWRGKAFDNDTGWRIDYAWCSPELAPFVRSVEVGRAPSYAERWSDHAAVVVDFAADAQPRRADEVGRMDP